MKYIIRGTNIANKKKQLKSKEKMNINPIASILLTKAKPDYKDIMRSLCAIKRGNGMEEACGGSGLFQKDPAPNHMVEYKYNDTFLYRRFWSEVLDTSIIKRWRTNEHKSIIGPQTCESMSRRIDACAKL